MADESNVMPTSQLVRWLAIAALILGAVLVYFREGTRVPPLGAGPPPVETPVAR